MEELLAQDFKFDKIDEQNKYKVMSPLKDAKNAKRIKGVMSKLKLSVSIRVSLYLILRCRMDVPDIL